MEIFLHDERGNCIYGSKIFLNWMFYNMRTLFCRLDILIEYGILDYSLDLRNRKSVEHDLRVGNFLSKICDYLREIYKKILFCIENILWISYRYIIIQKLLKSK